MANIKQQKKRILVAERQRVENIRYRSSIKTAFRRLVEAVQSGDADAVSAAHQRFIALVDRAAARRALHANTAARKKARATRVIARGPQVEEAKKRRVTRKTAAKAPKAAVVEDAVAEDAAAEEAPADAASAAKPSRRRKAEDAPAAEAEADEAEGAAEGDDAPAGDAAEGDDAPADDAAEGDDAPADDAS